MSIQLGYLWTCGASAVRMADPVNPGSEMGITHRILFPIFMIIIQINDGGNCDLIEGIEGIYTKKDKAVITRDWESQFKEFKKYKPLTISNRVGPLVMNIMLKMSRAGNFYTPVLYVHNLCREFPCFTLTLRCKAGIVSPEQHNKIYIDEAIKVKNESYIPVNGDITIDTVIEGYERYFKNPIMDSYLDYEDLVLFCGWTGQADKIEYTLKLVYKELKKWPQERFFSQSGGFVNWFQQLEKNAWEGDLLNKIYEAEYKKHKCEKIPEREIILLKGDH